MRAAMFGAMLGLIAIWIGLLVGLQVNVLFGKILVFPVAVVASISGVSIMMMSPALWIVAVVIQCLTWALIFYVFSRLARLAAGRQAH